MNPKKSRYRIRNWGEYNRSLVNRGSMTFWFSQEVVDSWYAAEKTQCRGRPKVYADEMIRCGLMVRALFKIPLRMLQGFIASLIMALGIGAICPHYSVFCRRAKGLKLPLRRLVKSGERLNIVFDSTGVKVFGEGEWKVRKHGYSKRRTWRKIHVGMCADTGQVVVSAISAPGVSDEQAMIRMMSTLDDVPLGDVLGDGAYDTTDCRQAIYDSGGRQVIPPRRTAREQKERNIPALEERDEAVRRIKELGEEGRALWKREIGYHRRSRVETCMFRYKTILGDRFVARRDWSQTTEVAIKLDLLNRMTELGMPKSQRVEN
jgi:DDE family transposase